MKQRKGLEVLDGSEDEHEPQDDGEENLEALDETDVMTSTFMDELSEQVLELRTEETALIERIRLVIDALEEKGGDGQEAETFILAVSSLDTTTDSASFLALIRAQLTAWAKHDDGGKLWLKRGVLIIIILLFFRLVSKFVARKVERAFERNTRVSDLLTNFVGRTTGGLVKAIGYLMALAVMGVPITPLLAALGGGGFIIGFALQETLGNFASGMLIMIYRPFDLNDYVKVGGDKGTVKHMSLVSTTLVTLDNKLLIIPNKTVWGETITNITGIDLRRVDLVFGIGYDDDIEKALKVLMDEATSHELVLDDPLTTVHVDELGDSSVNLFCRPWVKTPNYWTVYWDLTRSVKERFYAEGISIPFPQRDVHVNPGKDALG